MPTISNAGPVHSSVNDPGFVSRPGTSRPRNESLSFGNALLNVGARDEVAPIHVLLAEPMGPIASGRIQGLSPTQAQVTSVPHSTADALTATVLDTMKGRTTDLLVVRGNCKVDRAFLDQLTPQERPSFVLRAGTGLDNLDMDYLDALGIAHGNTPDVNTQSTAELALGLMLSVKRKISQADSQVKSGQWNRSALTGSELGGKTLGIIGVGRIGGVVGVTAKALGMEVIGLASARRQQNDADRPDYLKAYVSLDELCTRSDVLTVHVPLNNSTRDMIGKKQLEQLSGRNAVVINVARGGVVNEVALLEALDDGLVAGAGIDVFVEDPAPHGSVSDRLAQHPRVVATPHVGGQTLEASEKMGDAVVQQAQKMFLQRSVPQGGLND